MSVPAVSDVNGKPALRRKQSTPMMPPFMVSAPGKVIVYGEHAVVHGKVYSVCPLSRGAL
jgi:mevalonate kinase